MPCGHPPGLQISGNANFIITWRHPLENKLSARVNASMRDRQRTTGTNKPGSDLCARWDRAILNTNRSADYSCAVTKDETNAGNIFTLADLKPRALINTIVFYRQQGKVWCYIPLFRTDPKRQRSGAQWTDLKTPVSIYVAVSHNVDGIACGPRESFKLHA